MSRRHVSQGSDSNKVPLEVWSQFDEQDENGQAIDGDFIIGASDVLVAWEISDQSEKGKVLVEQKDILVRNLKVIMKENKKEKKKTR